MFSAVPRSSGPVFKLCAPGLIFGGTEGVGSPFHVMRSQTHFRRYRFHIFRSRTRFRRYRGSRVFFHVLRSRTHLRRYRGRRVPFSCFALPDSFSAVSRTLGPIFLFCALELLVGGTDGVGFPFHVLRSRNRFRRYRGRPIPFSSFPLPNMFLAVPRASGPIFMFCTPGLLFDGTECVGSCFQVLRSRTRFRRYRGSRLPFSGFWTP
jgi:hypothetical protein